MNNCAVPERRAPQHASDRAMYGSCDHAMYGSCDPAFDSGQVPTNCSDLDPQGSQVEVTGFVHGPYKQSKLQGGVGGRGEGRYGGGGGGDRGGGRSRGGGGGGPHSTCVVTSSCIYMGQGPLLDHHINQHHYGVVCVINNSFTWKVCLGICYYINCSPLRK